MHKHLRLQPLSSLCKCPEALGEQQRRPARALVHPGGLGRPVQGRSSDPESLGMPGSEPEVGSGREQNVQRSQGREEHGTLKEEAGVKGGPEKGRKQQGRRSIHRSGLRVPRGLLLPSSAAQGPCSLRPLQASSLCPLSSPVP